MALNGIDPLLVIVFKVAPPKNVFGPPAPTSLVNTILQAVGVPIPIYLSEKLTGIYVQDESRGIDVSTEVEAQATANPAEVGSPPGPIVSQNAVAAQLTINMLCRKGNLVLTAIIALMEQIMARLVTQEYAIHYLNNGEAIFGAQLHRFATTRTANDDLVRIELTLSTASKQPPVPKAVPAPIANTVGATPL